jgi:hypothetical protein
MLLANMLGKLAGARLIGQRTGRNKAVSAVVFEEIAHDNKPAVHSIGQHDKLLSCGVECAENVGPGLMFIE